MLRDGEARHAALAWAVGSHKPPLSALKPAAPTGISMHHPEPVSW